MKKISLFITSMLVSGACIAGTANETGTTTCHVLKNGQPIKKGTCSFDETIGSSMSYSFYDSTFKMRGIGTMSISYDHVGQTVTFNNEKAFHQYRKPSTSDSSLDTVSSSYAKSHRSQVLNCYKSLETPWEICTPRTPFF